MSILFLYSEHQSWTQNIGEEMNTIKKKITVRFFSIRAKDSFFKNFPSSFLANSRNSPNARVLNIKGKKHLIKAVKSDKAKNIDTYSLTLVRERNTWQTKASRDGDISGITQNQGLIGDPYYLLVVPNKKLLLGFTTGPSGSLKSVGSTALEQFNNDRTNKVTLDLIPKEKEFDKLNNLPEFSSLHFKLDSSSLSDVSDDAPQLIKDLSSAPYIDSGIQLSLDFEIENSEETPFSKESLLEIINFLSDHEGCSVLKIRGTDSDGIPVNLDFGNAFLSYNTEVTTRNKYIDEPTSEKVLSEALEEHLAS